MSEAEKKELLTALKAALQLLEHPLVNEINFCGSPLYLGLNIRALLARHGMTADEINRRAR